MKKFLSLISFALVLLLSSCTEYSQVLKSKDIDYKYDYAKRAFDQGKWLQTSTILTDLITPLRGGPRGEEALYLLAMSHFNNKDYLNSGVYFKTYYQRYPKGKYAEYARYYAGYGYYLDSPDPQLDQTETLQAIKELQGFIDFFPRSEKVKQAQEAMFEMQDKLTLKELQNAQLYYNLGSYMGNNYQSAIIVADNALKTYPYSKYREQLEMLKLKAKFQEARQSVDERKLERYREVIDEYYSFINNYPDTDNRHEADNIFRIASNFVKE
ncbi:MAG: outer membrane protein assembly factor BamD [Bacteroidales bacterium]|nr:outer membrane protein assembly factor BamD [Bacteroidales bacterium]